MRKSVFSFILVAALAGPTWVLVPAQASEQVLSVSVAPAAVDSPTFADVSPSHPFYSEIEWLHANGYTAGCAVDPLRYCPEGTMNRAESAVFAERGIHDASYEPSAPSPQLFADLPLDSWAAKWAQGLFEDGYTAGCGSNPLVFCPWQGHTRAEGAVFYLRMLKGSAFVPDQPTRQTFADVPLDAWYARWVQAAYEAGLIPSCQTSPQIRFCPDDPLSRGLAGYMMVQAKSASGRIYYVSTSGDDSNPGTRSQPFRTVQKGIAATQDGDTIYIEPGVYDLQKLNVTLYKSIRLIGEDKNTTELTNGKRITFHKGITVRNLKFTHFDKTSYDDAIFRPIADAGETIDGTYLDNLVGEDLNAFIRGNGSGGNISNFNVTNCTLTNINSSWSVFGIYVNTPGSMTHFRIRDNTFSNLYTTTDTRDVFGIMFGSDENFRNAAVPRPTNILIEDNTLEHLTGGTVQNTSYYAQARGILVYGDYITVNRNTVKDINPSPAHTGIYLKASHSRITNNVIHNGGSAGSTAAVGSGDLTIKGAGNVGNVISGNRVTSDYAGAGIAIYTEGGVEISNNYVRKTEGYFGVYSYELLGRFISLKDNYIEIKAAGGQAMKVTDADAGEIAYNVIISYEGSPIYLGASTSNIDVHHNEICQGYSCGTPLPAHPSCQNVGYLCCSSCGSGSHSQYDSTCSAGYVCCETCGQASLSLFPSGHCDVNLSALAFAAADVAGSE